MAETKTKDPYLEVIREVVGTKHERGELYKKEPKDIVPIEALEGVLLYKVTRAYNAIDTSKKRDNLIDAINYAAFIVERIDAELSKEE